MSKHHSGRTIRKFSLPPLDSLSNKVVSHINTNLAKGAEDELLDTSRYSYSELVGSLLYLATCSRPDIQYAAGALARHLAAPARQHWEAAKGVLRYLAGTVDVGLVYGGGPAELVGYCDADFAGDLDRRRSTTGYVFIMHGGAVSWRSRLQPTVAVSTMEAEYMAAAQAVREGLWLRKLQQDLGEPAGAIRIRCDNQGTLKLLKNPVSSQRAKHIDVTHHFVRERVERGEAEFAYCPSTMMLADCLTKALPAQQFVACCSGVGLE